MKKVALVKDQTHYYPLYKTILEEFGIQVKLYDIWKENQINELLYDSFDGFIWRAKHNPPIKRLAKRLVYLFKIHNIPTHPTWTDYWHFDDKIAQSFLYKKNDVAVPETEIFFSRDKALDFIDRATFPLIYKCAHGAGSSNVGLLTSRQDARRYAKKAFGKGIRTYYKENPQKGYVYFQEYISGPSEDYRVVCFGEKIMNGYGRIFERKNDFRAHRIKRKEIVVNDSLLQFVADIHNTLGHSIMAYDIMDRGGENWVVNEMSAIFGDLDQNILLDTTLTYFKTGDSWISEQTSDTHVTRTMNIVLKEQWKWF